MSGQAGIMRGLLPGTVARRATSLGGDRAIAWAVLGAVVAHLTVSASALTLMGIHYDQPGGLPFAKFHVATYLALFAVVLQASRQRPVMPGLIAQIARTPHFPLAALLVLASATCALFAVGLNAVTVYIDNFVSAAMLGFALEQQSPQNLRRIASTMIAIITANAALCIIETALQWRLMPIWLVDLSGEVSRAPEYEGEFRGTALYDHPLTGAMITVMGVFLCLASRLRPIVKAAVLAVLLVSLITFGGRSAMALTYALLACLVLVDIVRRLIVRQMNARYMAILVAALAVVPAALGFILFATSLGQRIAGHFYADDSAEVRILQWLVLARMDTRDWLFGMDTPRLDALMLQVGLNAPFNDIENFWLLIFLTLGAVGFTFWLGGFGVMLWHLWRRSGLFGRIMLVMVIDIASTNNSLGRKSNIFFVCVAAVMATTGFAAPDRPRATRRAGLVARFGRPATVLPQAGAGA